MGKNITLVEGVKISEDQGIDLRAGDNITITATDPSVTSIVQVTIEGEAGSGGGADSITFTKTGTISTGTGTTRWYNDTGATLTIVEVRASVGTAPTDADAIFDVHKNGTTIFTTQSNRPTIAASANTGSTTTIEVSTIDDGQFFTVDIDQVGSTVAGADVTVTIWMTS